MGTDDLGPGRPDPRVMRKSPRTHSPRTDSRSPKALRTGPGLVLAAAGIALVAGLSACGASTTTTTTTTTTTPGSGLSGHAASGPTTGATATDGTIDPCSLLTEARLSDIIGAAVTVNGPAVELARGRSCTYTFHEPGNAIVDEASIGIAAWHGAEFFATGTPGAGIGADAQDDSAHGFVTFRDGEEVVQVQVLSPDHKKASLEIARVADSQVAVASRRS